MVKVTAKLVVTELVKVGLALAGAQTAASEEMQAEELVEAQAETSVKGAFSRK